MADGPLPLLAQHLSTSGLGSLGASPSTGAASIVYRSVVESTGVLLALMETPGLSPVRTYGDGAVSAIERPRLQLLSRTTSPSSGSDVPFSSGASSAIRRAAGLLENISNTTIGGSTFHRVATVQAPYQLQRDDAGRILFAANFDVWWAPSSST